MKLELVARRKREVAVTATSDPQMMAHIWKYNQISSTGTLSP